MPLDSTNDPDVLGGTFWDRGFSINRREGAVLAWDHAGWLPWRKRQRTEAMSAFSEVYLDREIERRGKHDVAVMPIRLTGSDNPLLLAKLVRYEEARQIAEDVARFTNLPLRDACSAVVVLRAPSELDESLRDRARRTGQIPNIPPRPDNMWSKSRVEGDTLVLDIPPRSIGRFCLILTLFFIVVGGLALNFGLRGTISRQARETIVGSCCFFLFMAAVIGFFQILARRTRTLIRTSPKSLWIQARNPIGTRVTEFRADEIEEMLLPPCAMTEEEKAAEKELERPPAGTKASPDTFKGIQVRTDKAKITFGHGLKPEELRWMHVVLTRILIA